MGNQQVNGTTPADTSMRPASRRGSGGGDGGGGGGGPNNPTSGANNNNSSNNKPPPGGSAPADYMQSHASQYGPGGASGGVRRSTSDHSMTDMGGGGTSSASYDPSSSSRHRGPGGSVSQGHIHVPLDLASLSAAEDDSVPTVFRWEHGGRNVYITGTFNGWSRQIPMHRSGNDFTYIHNLRRGKHAFKFIVDDEWRFAPDQPTVADIEGRINNFIDVTDFKAYTGDTEFENERHAVHCSRAAAEAAKVKNAAAIARRTKSSSSSSSEQSSSVISPHHHQSDDNSSGGAGGRSNTNKAGGGAASKGASKSPGGIADLDGEIYGHSMPDLDEYTKEPPPLPPHLRHIILNKPPQLQDTAALPVPQHVALNHLYCTAIKDNMMVLGITQRYKMKSCTTVYYSPC